MSEVVPEPSPELQLLYEARRKREQIEDVQKCEQSLSHFIKQAWPSLKPDDTYVHNWHIDAVAEHLEAVTSGEITRLQVWLPPGAMKSLSVSVFWPAWEWTTKPNMRYWGASYETRFAARLSAMSRDLMLSDWYQERWGDKFRFTRDAENYYANDHGGTRLATSPESVGTGEHGHRVLIDDPVKAKEADAVSGAILKDVNEWYDGTVATRGLEIGFTPARIIVMQRLSEFDLAAHALEIEEWDVLCLPENANFLMFLKMSPTPGPPSRSEDFAVSVVAFCVEDDDSTITTVTMSPAARARRSAQNARLSSRQSDSAEAEPKAIVLRTTKAAALHKVLALNS